MFEWIIELFATKTSTPEILEFANNIIVIASSSTQV